jgi:hypothetical protein
MTAKTIRERFFPYMQAALTILDETAPNITAFVLGTARVNTTTSSATVAVAITVTDDSLEAVSCGISLLFEDVRPAGAVNVQRVSPSTTTFSTSFTLALNSKRGTYMIQANCSDETTNRIITNQTVLQVGYSSNDEPLFKQLRVLDTQVDVASSANISRLEVTGVSSTINCCDVFFRNNVTNAVYSASLKRAASFTILSGKLQLLQTIATAFYTDVVIFCYDALGLASVDSISSLSIRAVGGSMTPELTRVRVTPTLLDLTQNDQNATISLTFRLPTGFTDVDGWNVTLSDGGSKRVNSSLTCSVQSGFAACPGKPSFQQSLGPFGVFRVAQVEIYDSNGDQYIYQRTNDLLRESDTVTSIGMQLHEMKLTATHNWQKDGQDLFIEATVEMQGLPVHACIVQLLREDDHQLNLYLYPVSPTTAPIALRGQVWVSTLRSFPLALSRIIILSIDPTIHGASRHVHLNKAPMLREQ